jgi:hypothetical protein
LKPAANAEQMDIDQEPHLVLRLHALLVQLPDVKLALLQPLKLALLVKTDSLILKLQVPQHLSVLPAQLVVLLALTLQNVQRFKLDGNLAVLPQLHQLLVEVMVKHLLEALPQHAMLIALILIV